jgi:hypothetical protein
VNGKVKEKPDTTQINRHGGGSREVKEESRGAVELVGRLYTEAVIKILLVICSQAMIAEKG